MDWLRQLHFRLLALFRRRDLEAEMAEEMRSHLQCEADARRAQGVSDEQARDMAHRAFGGVEQVKERCRDEVRFTWLEQVWQDVRFALRAMVRAGGFTAGLVGTLTLGMGAALAIFCAVAPTLFYPAPY